MWCIVYMVLYICGVLLKFKMYLYSVNIVFLKIVKNSPEITLLFFHDFLQRLI